MIHSSRSALRLVATERLTLGTAICLVTEHNPITLAKSIASVDVISNGRLVVGIGAGWNAEEMANHGVPFDARWKITRERVLAMREIWTHDEPEYHGKYVDFAPLWSWPKPVQPGGPRILLGAGSKWSYDRVADYCDGWMPIDFHDDIEGGLARDPRRLRPGGSLSRLVQLDPSQRLPNEARIAQATRAGSRARAPASALGARRGGTPHPRRVRGADAQDWLDVRPEGSTEQEVPNQH